MKTLFTSLTIMLSLSVHTTTIAQDSGEKIEIYKSSIRVEQILTAEEQAALTPKDVILSLQAGNERFVRSDLTAREHSIQIRESVAGQYPKAIVLSCVDSRVPVEDVFDKGIGDLFVARVAGNFVNDDILGSMEFACKVSGAKLILVMGHENCGAIHAAIDGAKLGNITKMLKNIAPAITMSTVSNGARTSQNRLLVHEVCENNVRQAISKIKKDSRILNDMFKKGEIDIQGAVYDMDTGVVNFMN